MFGPSPYELLVVLAALAFTVFPFWKIFARAGFSGALSLLMLLPLVNIVMLFFLAFADWPAVKHGQDVK